MADGQPGEPANGPLPATSRTLLLGLRDGDPEAWSRFVRTYGVAMRRWCRALLPPAAPADLADDLAQTALIQLNKSLRRFVYDPAKRSFRGWLRTVTLRSGRRALRRKGLFDPKHVPLPGDGSIGQPTLEQVDEYFAMQHTWTVFQEACDRVREETRAAETWAAFQLTLAEDWGGGGLPVAAAADRLNKDAQFVYTATSRIRKRLRKVLLELDPEWEKFGCLVGDAADPAGPRHDADEREA